MSPRFCKASVVVLVVTLAGHDVLTSRSVFEDEFVRLTMLTIDRDVIVVDRIWAEGGASENESNWSVV